MDGETEILRLRDRPVMGGEGLCSVPGKQIWGFRVSNTGPGALGREWWEGSPAGHPSLALNGSDLLISIEPSHAAPTPSIFKR